MWNTPQGRHLGIEGGPHDDNGFQAEENSFFTAQVDTLQTDNDPPTRNDEEDKSKCECWGLHPCLVLLIAVGILAVLMKIGIVITIVVRHVMGVMELKEREALENLKAEAS